MTAGVKFFTNGLTSQLDNNRICPQLVGRFDMANEDQFDIETPQPGWNIRLFRWHIPPAVIDRPCIIFCSIPNQGYEVYGNAYYVAYQAGQPFVAPIIYVFALDYVSYSNSDHGMRLWQDNGGPLVYDSGNFHLNLRKSGVISVDASVGAPSLNYPTGGTNSFNLGFPANCAINMPELEITRDWGERFGASGDMRADPLFRMVGGALQVKMFTTEQHFVVPGNASSSFDHLRIGNSAAVQMIAIDRTMYD